ncbi:hypothetical protein NKJ35_25030 [Mesorhizobium sp. M0136]|uniref:hypothetical protein n=1 Tax=Mesorhizobium sp. M0136 TaxID=2956890 RepID=UPI00333787CC
MKWIRVNEPPLSDDQDVGTLWSESISRLGIQPLFPPQEDFYVGDIYAVISAYDEEDGTTREKAPNRPLLRKSVKIGHIDLRNVSLGTPGAPIFATTKIESDKTASTIQDQLEVPATADGRLKVTLVAFPGLKVSDDSNVDASFLDWFSLSAGRRNHQDEMVTIKVAETYGASNVESVLALSNWCAAEATKLYCSDAFARKMLGYIVNNEVFDVRDNKYVYRLDIRLVTRVYMTRAIDFRRSNDGSVGGSIGEEARKPDAPAPAAPPPASAATSDVRPSAAPDNGAGFGRSGELTMAIGNVLYQRPVVFGFKSVTFALDPSIPEAAPAAASKAGEQGKAPGDAK